jgi:hypothetical protein
MGHGAKDSYSSRYLKKKGWTNSVREKRDGENPKFPSWGPSLYDPGYVQRGEAGDFSEFHQGRVR